MLTKQTEYFPEIQTNELKPCNLKFEDIFEVFIDSTNNIVLRARTKLNIISSENINIISQKDITVLSGNALGYSNGFISLNPSIDISPNLIKELEC